MLVIIKHQNNGNHRKGVHPAIIMNKCNLKKKEKKKKKLTSLKPLFHFEVYNKRKYHFLNTFLKHAYFSF